METSAGARVLDSINGVTDGVDKLETKVDKFPLSQGKPIEWKHTSAIRLQPKHFVPLSQGKPIEWKLAIRVPVIVEN